MSQMIMFVLNPPLLRPMDCNTPPFCALPHYAGERAKRRNRSSHISMAYSLSASWAGWSKTFFPTPRSARRPKRVCTPGSRQIAPADRARQSSPDNHRAPPQSTNGYPSQADRSNRPRPGKEPFHPLPLISPQPITAEMARGFRWNNIFPFCPSDTDEVFHRYNSR